jgi:hypothetical protein
MRLLAKPPLTTQENDMARLIILAFAMTCLASGASAQEYFGDAGAAGAAGIGGIPGAIGPGALSTMNPRFDDDPFGPQYMVVVPSPPPPPPEYGELPHGHVPEYCDERDRFWNRC